MTYGKQTPTSYSDPEVQGVNKALKNLGRALRPGAYLADSYPVLKYLPFYMRDLRQQHLEELNLYRSQLDSVKAQVVGHFRIWVC